MLMKKIVFIVLLFLITFGLYACGGNQMSNPTVAITVEGYDEPMVLELYYDKAPNTVENFINLANSGFYDGSSFHRIIEDFMIQGGIGSTTTCAIAGEFTNNGFSGNDISHVRGVISMARTSVMNSATSQFFIMHGDSLSLDGNYAAFGMLISGFDTLDAIATVETGSQDRPLETVTITSIIVDTHGVSYDKPKCAN
jgi:peptidyl-prolyl cis-trans isomerase B (cyclophilin B)